MDEVDYFANGLWFVWHVGFIGFAVSYLINNLLFELEGYQWFLAPLGAFTRFYYYYSKEPIMKSETRD